MAIEAAQQLLDHKTYDHATYLNDGQQPPWEPLYALSETDIYLFIYFISFNVIQPMWLCRQILTHKIADMSERRKQANKQKKTKQHT
jgi:hypothetical protein